MNGEMYKYKYNEFYSGFYLNVWIFVCSFVRLRKCGPRAPLEDEKLCARQTTEDVLAPFVEAAAKKK